MSKKIESQAPEVNKIEYGQLLCQTVELIKQARHLTARAVNAILTAAYWEIGRLIVEFEQGGEQKAEYGDALLEKLATDLVSTLGRGLRTSSNPTSSLIFAKSGIPFFLISFSIAPP